MPRLFYSYKTIPEEAIQLTWFVYDAPLPKDCVIKRWKKNLDLHLSLQVYLNNNAILQSVSSNSSIAFYICYHSLNKHGGTSLHGLAKKVLFRNTEEKTQDIPIDDILINGTEISGVTEISFYAVLERPGLNEDVSIFATEKGTILFEQSIFLYLEGNQALFPVKAIDFTDSSEITGKNSLYYLKKRYSSLDSNFNSSYMLYLNSKHKLFNVINSDNENDLIASYLLKMIMYDIYRMIVEDALNPDTGLISIIDKTEDDFTLQAVYSRIITDLINLYFPDNDLDGMRKLLNSDEASRNALYTAIQDYIIGV